MADEEEDKKETAPKEDSAPPPKEEEAAPAPDDGSAEELAAAKQQTEALEAEVDRLREAELTMLAEAQEDSGTSVIPILDARYVPGFGKYMVPKHNTLNEHYQLVYDRSNELDFWPKENEGFDGIISQIFLAPAFLHTNHPKYFDYEPLRDNIATVRNYVFQQLLSGVDLNDENALKFALWKSHQMSREIGMALRRDTIFRAPGSLRLDVKECSKPGEGAAKIYELLLEHQGRKRLFWPLSVIFDREYDEWGLPPIEQSPFSKENVRQFCMQYAPPPEPTVASEPISSLAGHELAVIGAALTASAFSTQRVEKLPRPVKDRAVELARDILNKLRMDFNQEPVEQWLNRPSEDAVVYTHAIAELGALYANTYQTAMQFAPELEGNALLLQANLAMGKLAYLLKEQAAIALEREGNNDDAALIRADIQSLPPEWKNIQGVTVDQLLASVQTGLEVSYATVRSTMQSQQTMRSNMALQAQSSGPRLRGTVVPTAAGIAPVAGMMQPAPQPKQPSMEDLVSGLDPQELQAMREMGGAMPAGGMNPSDVARMLRTNRAAAQSRLQEQQDDHSGGAGHAHAVQTQKTHAADHSTHKR